MNALLIGMGLMVLCVALTIGGMLFFRSRAKVSALKVDREVATALVSILGTLYAIVLGLVVIDALNHRGQAETMELAEGNSLANILNLCRSLPQERRRTILQAELNYSEEAIDKEWDLLARGTVPDAKTAEAYGQLWNQISSFDPRTSRETSLHNNLLQAMTQFSDARRYRIISCKHGLPTLLWLILVIGGACTIAYIYFFAAEPLRVQIIMVSIVTLVSCMNILLVFFYGMPYMGDLRIEPSSLAHVRDMLRAAPELKSSTDTTKLQDSPRTE